VNEATKRLPVSWPGTSAVPVCFSSARVSSVTTRGASTSKWTTISEPSASVRLTVARRRELGGASFTTRASSMSSLRMPTATSRSMYSESLARCATSSAPRARRAEPMRNIRPPPSRSSRPSAMFIGGDPMKPATKMLSGLS
jgi:hypothetical protein